MRYFWHSGTAWLLMNGHDMKGDWWKQVQEKFSQSSTELGALACMCRCFVVHEQIAPRFLDAYGWRSLN